MSEAGERDEREESLALLRALGAAAGPTLPIAEAALALAALQRPHVGLARYREHLQWLARDVGRHKDATGDLGARARALNEIILLKYGYRGDDATYDDLQNANLIRVIDRRKGLPVVLGILYIHAARAQGWDIAGLSFPGHFLVRLAAAGQERLILDPFHGGKICEAAELRALLKAVAGPEQQLAPEHYAPVSDRDVLLRLQNNLKARLLHAEEAERAVAVVESMLLLAPDAAELWQEAAALYRHLGNLPAAANALGEFIVRAPEGIARHQAAAVLQQLRGRLN
jgi:regulator of sirC expression with transglutaminase-like and TPR domain